LNKTESEKNMQIIKTLTTAQCAKFEVTIDEKLVAYYYEHSINPETGEQFERPVFELYYDELDGQFDEILITEDFEEIEGILDSMM
jgi:hypothetical protein